MDRVWVRISEEPTLRQSRMGQFFSILDKEMITVCAAVTFGAKAELSSSMVSVYKVKINR